MRFKIQRSMVAISEFKIEKSACTDSSVHDGSLLLLSQGQLATLYFIVLS